MSGVRANSEIRRHSDGEAKTRATVRDIDELYSALQSLVPKQNAQTSKTRVTKNSMESESKSPALQRRYNSVHITTSSVAEEPLYRVVSAGNLTESSKSADIKQSKAPVYRAKSLPTFLEEETEEEREETKKKSRFFSIFGRRRRHSKPKAPKKRRSSWRAFLSSLSLRGSSAKKAKKTKAKKTRKRQKARNDNEETTAVTKPAAVEIKVQSQFPQVVRTRNVTPSLTRSATTAATLETTSPRFEKRRAPEPPEQDNTVEQRRHSFGNNIDDVDEVQKKISAWYKYAVRESNTEPRRTLRNYKSQESLLSVKGRPKERNFAAVASSDTDGVTPENLENLRRIRVRKTRARRNRQKERARWRSLPNVKLLSQVVNNETTNKTTDAPNEHTSEVLPPPEEQISPTYSTIVTPVEADIPLPETKSSETPKKTEALTDFMRMRRDSVSQYISIRQRSRTSESYTRPLKLNFFYSESPSRETVHRSQSLRFPSKLWFTGNPETDNQVSMTAHRNPSRRHRKRKSFKERQSSRMSQQSPFYFPNDANEPSQFTFPDVEEPEKEEVKVDSGIGSPSVAEDQGFGLTPVGKRKHSEDDALKLSWESEDSGWASRDFVNRVDFGTQTDSRSRTIDIGENSGQATALGQF